MLCRVAAVRRLPIYHHIQNDILWSFGISGSILSHFENSLVLLKPVLGAVIGVAYLTSIKTESAVFMSLVFSLLPKDLNM